MKKQKIIALFMERNLMKDVQIASISCGKYQKGERGEGEKKMKCSEKIEKIQAIIKKHEISCGEDVWQCDSISENALTIIEEICEIIGYYKVEEKERKQ